MTMKAKLIASGRAFIFVIEKRFSKSEDSPDMLICKEIAIQLKRK